MLHAASDKRFQPIKIMFDLSALIMTQSVRMRRPSNCNLLLNSGCCVPCIRSTVPTGPPIKYSLMTHLQASLNAPYCLLILSLVMAFRESSILKSERRWMTAVIKLKKKEKTGDTADQFRWIHTAALGLSLGAVVASV